MNPVENDSQSCVGSGVIVEAPDPSVFTCLTPTVGKPSRRPPEPTSWRFEAVFWSVVFVSLAVVSRLLTLIP